MPSCETCGHAAIDHVESADEQSYPCLVPGCSCLDYEPLLVR